ncbi:MAG: DUF420 domain-containing protein [bacterium]|nr:DUF420 domain-containing protein [bacterium]
MFWAGALILMTVMVGLAANGVRQIRRGQVTAHRRSMSRASNLVVLFLLSYLVKRVWIGAEDLDPWSQTALANLWIHETMVAGMLISGGSALYRGRQLARTRRATGSADDPPAEPAAIRKHRLAGWIGVVASALGLLTACGVLAQIFNLSG